MLTSGTSGSAAPPIPYILGKGVSYLTLRVQFYPNECNSDTDLNECNSHNIFWKWEMGKITHRCPLMYGLINLYSKWLPCSQCQCIRLTSVFAMTLTVQVHLYTWQIKIFSASLRHVSFDQVNVTRVSRGLYASTCDANFVTPTSQ